jgi:molecular chaperone GrpE
MIDTTQPGAPAEAPPASPEGAPASAESGKPALEQLLAEAEARVQVQRDAWLRALADTENVRKRAESDIAGAHRFGAERLLGMLVPVMDSLEAALASQVASAESLRSGVELTLKQLKSVFEKAGVAEISPAAGEKFDPHRHQAMAAVEADAEPNTVVDVMQKGYALHERVVRPALVSVSKARDD